jgi:hypothetical protein
LFYNFELTPPGKVRSVDLDPAALATSGISVDSAAHSSSFGTSECCWSTSGIPGRTTNTVSYIERFDLAPPPTRPNAVPGSIRAMTVLGRYARSEAQTLTPTAVSGFAGASTAAMGGVQGLFAKYFGKDGDYLNELTSGLSFNANRGTPYVELPSGSVLVASDLGLGSLAFEATALESNSHNWTWETIDQTDFLMKGKQSLPMKLYFQSRFDGFSQSLSANRLGRFGFNSLADLGANRPSSFSRTLNAPDRSGGQWIGAAAFGGNWTPSNAFSMTGGLRVDASAFTAAPKLNRRRAGLSARARITRSTRFAQSAAWLQLALRSGRWRLQYHVNGSATSSRCSPSAAASKVRSILPSTLLADATSNTGAWRHAAVTLPWVGRADSHWRSFAADGANAERLRAASNFADTAVVLFARLLGAGAGARIWAGRRRVSSRRTSRSRDVLAESASARDVVDLNFAGTPRFTLADGRAVRCS